MFELLTAVGLLIVAPPPSNDALCQVTDAQELAATQEQLRALNPPEESATFFVAAATAVYVVVRPLSRDPNPRPIRVVITAKTDRAGAFEPVCDSGVEAYRHDDGKVLKAERAGGSSRWRIDIINQSSVSLGVVIYSSPLEDAAGPYPEALDFVCIDGKTRAQAPGSPARLLGDVAPVFRIEDQSGSIRDDVKPRVWEAIVRAIEAWNIAARTTGIGMAVASLVDGRGRIDLINARLAKYLTAILSYEVTSLEAQTGLRGVDMDLALASRVPGDTAWIDSSTFVVLGHELRTKLCAVDPRTFYGNELIRAQELVCGRTEARPTIVFKVVKTLSSDPRCEGASVFGCELGDGRTIELNSADFAYITHSDRRILFGDGAERIDMTLVSLHEVGHALGLTHDALQGAATIMDSYPKPEACLNNDVHLIVTRALSQVNTTRRQ